MPQQLNSLHVSVVQFCYQEYAMLAWITHGRPLCRFTDSRQADGTNEEGWTQDYVVNLFCIFLTHWGRDKVAGISQTTFSNTFS